MERLLHYTWQHRLYPYGSLRTEDGRSVEVITPGLPNSNAGPDFLDAKIRIGKELWVGNVEIHTVSSDWFRHGHEQDAAYDNVILHVVERIDGEVHTSSGRSIPQVVVHVPDYVEEHYAELLREDTFPPCYRNVADLSPQLVRQWLDCLAAERLESKTEHINHLAKELGGDWEYVQFIILARSFGFGINGDAFEEWARHIPLMSIGKHRDDLFQIEAFFLGQAGLLKDDLLQASHRDAALKDGYFQKLQREYRFLAHKFTLVPMNGYRWKFLRLRPQNFPHIRLVQLARLYYSQQVSVSSVMNTSDLDGVRKLFKTEVTSYWQNHYSFGAESRSSTKTLRDASVDSLIINMVVPMLYAYGRHRLKQDYCERALSFLNQMKMERNHITKVWIDTGLPVNTAVDSQALIQLRQHYCDRKDCLRCRFGMEYLKKTHVYHVLQEEKPQMERMI